MRYYIGFQTNSEAFVGQGMDINHPLLGVSLGSSVADLSPAPRGAKNKKKRRVGHGLSPVVYLLFIIYYVIL